MMPDTLHGCPPRLSQEDIEIGEHSNLYAIQIGKKKDGLYGFTKPKKITHVLYYHSNTLTCHSGGQSVKYPHHTTYFYKEPREIPKPPEFGLARLTTEEKVVQLCDIVCMLTDRIRVLEEKQK
jgi:hypothetical protein